MTTDDPCPRSAFNRSAFASPSLHAARCLAADALAYVEAHGRARVTDQRLLCQAVVALVTQAETQQQQLFEALDYKQRYGDLVEEQNTIWDAARALGIDIFSSDGDVWEWSYRGTQGCAASAGAALAAALLNVERKT